MRMEKSKSSRSGSEHAMSGEAVPDRAAPSGPVADALYLAVEEMTERTSYGIDPALAFEDALARARKILAMLPSSAAAPCPHVRQDAEGSAYCTLAERAAPSGEPSGLTQDEVDAVAMFWAYGATRGNHGDEGRGPAPGPLTPYIDAMARVVGKLRATPAEPGASPPEGALADAIMPAYRFCEHIAKEFALDLEGWTWELFGTRDPEKLRDKLRVILPAYAWKYRADYEDVAGDAPREDALRKYGTHLSGCRLTNGGDRCTCGFETALRGPVSPSPGENIICPECRQFPCIGHPGTRAASEGEA
jgi:hypothetical protein